MFAEATIYWDVEADSEEEARELAGEDGPPTIGTVHDYFPEPLKEEKQS